MTLTLDPVDRHGVLLVLALLGIAGGLTMAAAGLPPVSLHLPTHDLGIMQPTCGLTRGVVRASVGDLVGAWRYNPAAAIAMVGAWLTVIRAGVGRLTGRWLNARLTLGRTGWTILIALVLLLEANQQMNAAMLA